MAMVKQVLFSLSVFLLSFDSLDQDIDLYVDTLSHWEQIESQVKEMHTGKKSPRNDRLNVWIEFRGFLHASLGVRPPNDWMYFLAMGGNHEQPTTGWFGEGLPTDDRFFVNINRVDFEIEGHATFSDGYIRRLDEKGAEIWTAKIHSTNKLRMPGTGIPCRTIWLDLEMSPDRKFLYIWGYSTFGNCFYQKLDFKSGKTIGRLILELPEKIYWEDASFRKSSNRRR